MTEEDLLFYFPYSIDKTYSFRYYSGNDSAFYKKYLKEYDRYEHGNVYDYLYKKEDINQTEKSRLHYLFENFAVWKDWFKQGKNIFAFSSELLEMLEKTDVEDITPNQFALPYDVFYISLKPLKIKISKESEEIIEGVFINHNIWDGLGNHPEGYCDLGIYFVGNFESLFSKFSSNVKSRVEDNIDTPWNFPIGSFWNIFLYFEESTNIKTVKQAVDYSIQSLRDEVFPKQQSGELVSDLELDFYNSYTHLVENTIKLVINCMLYLSLPVEKKDLKVDYPVGLPANLNKKLSFAKSKADFKKVDKKAEELGFTKIHFVGRQCKRATNFGNGETITPHWRRGHWRNQKFGKELNKRKLIWILPTVVNQHRGEPTKGHLYDVYKL